MACAVLLPVALITQAAEQRVYQWTDKDGVVHYSQFEPEKTKSEARDLHSSDGVAPAPVNAAPVKSASDDANCEMARTNQANLANGKAGQLTTDKDGDGKPEAMSDADIQAAKELAARQIAAFCKG
jgi:hypothetical protein